MNATVHPGVLQLRERGIQLTTKTGCEKQKGNTTCSPDAHIVAGAEGLLLANSHFGLCPRGGPALYTPRPVLSVAAGAIPVFLGRKPIPPFANSFDWSTFSLHVANLTDVGALDRVLSAVSQHRRRQLVANADVLRRTLCSLPTVLATVLNETWRIRERCSDLGLCPPIRGYPLTRFGEVSWKAWANLTTDLDLARYCRGIVPSWARWYWVGLNATRGWPPCWF